MGSCCDRIRHRCAAQLAFGVLLSMSAAAQADGLSSGPHFIGPLASPAPPLAKGGFNIEPYLMTGVSTAAFGANGDRHRSDAPAHWATSIPIQYGLTDRVSVGMTLRGQYDRWPDGSRAPRMGDTTLSTSLALHDFQGPQRARLALTLRRGIATGRHDRLEHARAPGSGSGASSTSLVLHGQAYFMEGLLRTRASANWTLPGARAGIRGRSVYGTDAGFLGSARLGHAAGGTLSAEYSIAPRWTLVGEALYEQSGATQVQGRAADGNPVWQRSPSSWSVSVLPAVQYHFSDQVGLIAGVQLPLTGRNTSATVVPQVALNVGF